MTDAESLQAAIHEDVALQAYDPRWPALFEAELAARHPGDREAYTAAKTAFVQAASGT